MSLVLTSLFSPLFHLSSSVNWVCYEYNKGLNEQQAGGCGAIGGGGVGLDACMPSKKSD